MRSLVLVTYISFGVLLPSFSKCVDARRDFTPFAHEVVIP